MRSVIKTIIVVLMLSFAVTGKAHDASAWGGLFRSRDFGTSWLPTDAGLYISGALSVAIDPRDPASLLYGTETRLLASRNGGRDWTEAAAADVSGGVFAVAYGALGTTAFAAMSNSVYRTDDLLRWKKVSLPSRASPLRAFVRGLPEGRVYAASSRGVLRSDDSGQTWILASEQMPEGAVISLVATAKSPQILYAIAAGEVWVSDDGAGIWRGQSSGIPPGSAQALTVAAGRVWIAAADQVFALSQGGNWIAQGGPLPDRATSVRGLVVSDDGKTIVLATHRGVYRSADQGRTWLLIEGTLPVHLEAGPLLRDPHEAATLYVGFALQPYDELWRRASGGSARLSEMTATSLIGAVAFLALLVIGGVLLARWLSRVAVHRK